MVLKKSKFNGNTGNTLRREKKMSGYAHAQKTAAFVSIHDYRQPGDFVDFNVNGKNPNHSTFTNVSYSLNKKNRWRFTKELMTEIETVSRQNKDDRITENKNGDKIVVVEESNDHSRAYSGISLYMDTRGETKVSMSCKPNIQIESQKVHDVAYKIEKTSRSTVWPYHTDKTRSFPRHAKVKNKKNIPRKCKFNYDSELDGFNENSLSDNNKIVCDEEMNFDGKPSTSDSCQFSLEDFISVKQKQRTKDRKRNGYKTRITQKQSTHDVNHKIITIINCDKLPDDPKTLLKTTVSSQQNDAEKETNETSKYSFDCSLYCSSIRYDFLQEKYGRFYLEGKSFPRRFIIFKKNTPCSPSLLVTVKNNELPTTTSVSITVVGELDPICNFEQFNNQLLNLDEIVDKIFPSIHYVENTTKVTTTSSSSMPANDMDIFKQHQNTATLSQVNAIGQTLMNELCSNGNTGVHIEHIADNFTNKTTVCGICFENIFSDGMALQACGHCFCHSCWVCYVKTKLSSEWTADVVCPESRCEAKLDLATLVSLCSYNDYIKYCRNYVNHYVLKDPTLKYCPTPNCTTVARVDKNTYNNNSSNDDILQADLPIVSCRKCARKWCFQCQGFAHWPVSCAVARNFDVPANFCNLTVNGKRCPYCSNLIEKDGGCNVMQCSCRPIARFCWSCLQPLNSFGANFYDHFPCTVDKEDEEFTSTSMDFLDKKDKSKLVAEAVKMQCSSVRIRRRLTKLRLKKFQLNVYLNNIQYNPTAEERSDSLVVFTKGAHRFLCDCYKFLKMLIAGISALVSSPNKSKRSLSITRLNKMTFLVGLVDDLVSIDDINSIDIPKIRKCIADISLCVDSILKIKCC